MPFKTSIFAEKTKNVTVNDLIIKLFGGAVKTHQHCDFTSVNKAAVKLGYLVHPDISTPDVLAYIESQQIDYGSTFYKKWSSVINKNRLELFIDQLRHYASTYGTNYTGTPYVPAEDAEVPSFTTFKVLLPLTKDEVIAKCETLLFTGIALKQETIQDVLTILRSFRHKLDVEKVKNKEAKLVLYTETGTLPVEPVEMVRYLVYLATAKTLLIKDQATLNAIKASKVNLTDLVEKFGYEKLATVFHRFKPIFLAFRSTRMATKKAPTYDRSYNNRYLRSRKPAQVLVNVPEENNVVVNRLRKLADKFHKPMKVGYFENILVNQKLVTDLPARLSEITNFKKILLLQTINVRLKSLSTNVYLIRNQKVHIDQDARSFDKNYLKLVYKIIYNDLISSLAAKACKISLPKGVNLTLPTSEKSFIGNYPLGTSFDLSKTDAIVGINWRGEDGADDLDLSLTTIDGTKYGWNAHYTNHDHSVIFSGDMTYADPEATELYYAANGFTPAIVKVNNYNGADNSKFKFFIAKERFTDNNPSDGYGRRRTLNNPMIDPNNILATFESEMDSKEKSLGVLTGDKFILAHFRTGKGHVSYNDVTNLYTDYAMNTLDCYLDLTQLLTRAGFTITDINPDMDLTTINKDTLIGLLS